MSLEKTTLVQELPVAISIRPQPRDINDLLSSVERDHQLRLDGFLNVVKNCVTSIMSNASAMFWLPSRHEDAYTAEHCLRVAFGHHLRRFRDFRKDLQTFGMCGKATWAR